MNDKALGLACLASLAVPSAMALERELAVAERTEVNLGLQLLNKHWHHGVVRHDDVSANGYANLRWYDIGLRLDGVMAIAGDDANVFDERGVTAFEGTEVTARLDYLFEIENVLQLIPFLETTVYPNISGRTQFNWIGSEIWGMLPWEGIEIGASAQYNLADNRAEEEFDGEDNHWLFEVGAREFWQDAPLDLMFWQIVEMANRSYHMATVGSDTQGITVLNLGGKATLPLPYEEMWAFLRLEGFWYLDSDDKDALDATGRDDNEVIIGIGIEYRME